MADVRAGDWYLQQVIDERHTAGGQLRSIELQALGSVISGCGAFVSGCLAILTIFDADAWVESP